MFGHEKYKIPVSEYVTPHPIAVSLETPFDEIQQIMNDNAIRHLPVVDKEKPVGIISHRDLSLALRKSSDRDLVARDVMTEHPYVIPPDTPLEKAAFGLSTHKIGSALIVEDGVLTGIFTTTDALNALIEVIRADVEEY